MVELMLVGLTLKPTSGAAADVADADRKITVKQTRMMRGFEVVYVVDSFLLLSQMAPVYISLDTFSY